MKGFVPTTPSEESRRPRSPESDSGTIRPRTPDVKDPVTRSSQSRSHLQTLEELVKSPEYLTRMNMTEEELKKKAATMTWKEASEEDRRIFKPIHDATQGMYEEFLEKQEIFVRQQRYRPVRCIKRLCEDWIDMTEDECNERVARMMRKQASDEDRRTFQSLWEKTKRELEEIDREGKEAMRRELEEERVHRSSSSGGDNKRIKLRPRINMIRLVEEVPDEEDLPRTPEVEGLDEPMEGSLKDAEKAQRCSLTEQEIFENLT